MRNIPQLLYRKRKRDSIINIKSTFSLLKTKKGK